MKTITISPEEFEAKLCEMLRAQEVLREWEAMKQRAAETRTNETE